MSNIKDGNAFEREFCILLAENGFWVHRLNQNVAGQQPADVIAIKGNLHTLIDCKVCSTAYGFRFSRVEDNQRSAMELFERKTGRPCWFALKLPDGQIRMLRYRWVPIQEERGHKGIKPGDIPWITTSFQNWLEAVNGDNHF